MKRLFAILLAAMLLFTVSALADEEITLFENEAGVKVTLTGDFNVVFDEDSGENYAQAVISREGCSDIIVIVNAQTEEAAENLNDLSDEEIENMRLTLAALYETDCTTADVTVDVTAAGNKYFNIVAYYIDEDGETTEYLHERYTIFDGFDFDRVQFIAEGSLTADDEVFMNDVQAAMWTKLPEAE